MSNKYVYCWEGAFRREQQNSLCTKICRLERKHLLFKKRFSSYFESSGMLLKMNDFKDIFCFTCHHQSSSSFFASSSSSSISQLEARVLYWKWIVVTCHHHHIIITIISSSYRQVLERKCRDVFEDECRFEEVEKCRTMQNRKWKKTCYSGNFITAKISPPSTNPIFSGIGLIMGCGRRECYDEEDLSNNLTSTGSARSKRWRSAWRWRRRSAEKYFKKKDIIIVIIRNIVVDIKCIEVFQEKKLFSVLLLGMSHENECQNFFLKINNSVLLSISPSSFLSYPNWRNHSHNRLELIIHLSLMIL